MDHSRALERPPSPACMLPRRSAFVRDSGSRGWNVPHPFISVAGLADGPPEMRLPIGWLTRLLQVLGRIESVKNNILIVECLGRRVVAATAQVRLLVRTYHRQHIQ